jgi:hypothetical protein
VTEVFVFDVFDDSLVMIPLEEARRLADLNDALETSATWGEFLARVVDDPKTMAHLREGPEEGLPSVEEPFDPDVLPGFADGTWPAFPKQAMLDWLPESVIKIGVIKSMAFGGSLLHLDEDLEEQIIAALADEGIDAHQDNVDLVGRASGAWRYS